MSLAQSASVWKWLRAHQLRAHLSSRSPTSLAQLFCSWTSARSKTFGLRSYGSDLLSLLPQRGALVWLGQLPPHGHVARGAQWRLIIILGVDEMKYHLQKEKNRRGGKNDATINNMSFYFEIPFNVDIPQDPNLDPKYSRI